MAATARFLYGAGKLQQDPVVHGSIDQWRRGVTVNWAHAAFILNKKPIPKQIPTLNTVVRLIAQRGGFFGRKGDGEPGVRTLWQGMHDVAVFVVLAEGLPVGLASRISSCADRSGSPVPFGTGHGQSAVAAASDPSRSRCSLQEINIDSTRSLQLAPSTSALTASAHAAVRIVQGGLDT